ncbi:UNKNOWN [Stylonychia lemnae]|uniref:Uncharacterized protein n=1 Tax=Stylonychia lemnae TaxID=5949 RepID=A0A078ADE9_STYLE|nr:UNKNOWN [Stylonychia lemnae]|eukprot:CDW80270.1 UNKNOWN [Stylonychia lemnae]
MNSISGKNLSHSTNIQLLGKFQHENNLGITQSQFIQHAKLSSLPSIMMTKGQIDENASMKINLIEKLVGKLKEGRDIKKRYMQMILSSSIQLDKEKIDLVNQSQKQMQPVTIIDQHMLRPDASLEKFVQINPLLGLKYTTLEDIKEEHDKYKSLMQNHKSLNELLRDEIVEKKSERGQRNKLNQIINQNQSFEIPSASNLSTHIKSVTFFFGSQFRETCYIQAQIRIKALANGVGLDTLKSANSEKRSMLKTLNSRIRQQNTSSFTNNQNSQLQTKIQENNSLQQTIVMNSFVSRNAKSQVHPTHTKNNKSQIIMGSPSIIKLLPAESSNEFTRLPTQNLSEFSTDQNGKYNRFRPPQVPDVQVVSKSQNFEIKLQNMEIIQQPHDAQKIRQKQKAKLARYNHKKVADLGNQQNIGQLITILKQNSRNIDDSLKQNNEQHTYQPIKQTLQNDSFKVDSRKSRISRVQSKSYLNSNSQNRKQQVSQDTEITNTFYKRFPNIQNNNLTSNEIANINIKSNFGINNKRLSVYDKVNKQEDLLMHREYSNADLKQQVSDFDSQADRNSSNIGGFMSKQTSFSRIQVPTYIHNRIQNYRNSTSFMGNRELPIELQVTKKVIDSYRRRQSNDSSHLNLNYYKESLQVIPIQKQNGQTQQQIKMPRNDNK